MLYTLMGDIQQMQIGIICKKIHKRGFISNGFVLHLTAMPIIMNSISLIRQRVNHLLIS